MACVARAASFWSPLSAGLPAEAPMAATVADGRETAVKEVWGPPSGGPHVRPLRSSGRRRRADRGDGACVPGVTEEHRGPSGVAGRSAVRLCVLLDVRDGCATPR